MAYTNFYCQASGSNLNAGSTTDDTALFTRTNGNWNQTTRVFTATGDDLSAVTSGMYASVYTDGATNTSYTAPITAVDNSAKTITLSGSSLIGSPPTTSATARTIKVGGAWRGPNAGSGWPLSSMTSSLAISGNGFPAVWLKNDGIYDVTAGISMGGSGFVVSGYSSTIGDNGIATIRGSTGANFVVLTVSGTTGLVFRQIRVTTQSTSGATNLWALSSPSTIYRCVVDNSRGTGWSCTATTGMGPIFVNCESYRNGLATGSTYANFNISGNATLVNCFSHHSANYGIYMQNAAGGGRHHLINCVSSHNASDGVYMTHSQAASVLLKGCTLANNTSDGLEIATQSIGTSFTLLDNIYANNGAYGVTRSGAVQTAAVFFEANCAYYNNTSGDRNNFTNVGQNWTYGDVIAPAAAPFVDATNGDFNPVGPLLAETGSGSFCPTGTPGDTYTKNLISYFDMGAVNHKRYPQTRGFASGGQL